MTARISRIVKRIGIVRTPALLPMSAQDRRINEELHRRREHARLNRERTGA